MHRTAMPSLQHKCLVFFEVTPLLSRKGKTNPQHFRLIVLKKNTFTSWFWNSGKTIKGMIQKSRDYYTTTSRWLMEKSY